MSEDVGLNAMMSGYVRISALQDAVRALCDAITEYLIVVPDGPVARMEALKPVLDAHAAARALLEKP